MAVNNKQGRVDLDDREFLETQAAKADLSKEDSAKVPELVNLIWKFILAFSGKKLYFYQEEFGKRIIESILRRDGDELTILISRQAGKTEGLTDTVCGLMILLPRLVKVPKYARMLHDFRDGFVVGIFAPVLGQADTLYARVVNRFTSDTAVTILSDPEIDEPAPKAKGDTYMLPRCKSSATKMSAHAKANIESKTFHLIVIDEAQAADEAVITKCLAEGTPVWLPDGRIVPVEQVVNERLEVLSYDTDWKVPIHGAPVRKGHGYWGPTGQLQATVPTEWHANGEQPVFAVLLASGRSIQATAGHRWVARSRTGNRRSHWYLTAQLQPGMAVPQPRGVQAWGTRGSELDGYFVGAMLGDGCTTGDSPMWCGFADGSSAEMQAYVEALGCTAKLNHVQPSGLQEFSYTTPGNGLNPLTAWLRAEGLWGLKGENKQLSRMDYSEEFFCGFVAGLLDTDGCASGKTLSWTTISERLMRQLQDALTKLGAYSFLQVRENNGRFGRSPKPLWTVTVKGCEDVLLLNGLIHSRNKSAAVRRVAAEAGKRNWSHRSSSDPRREYSEDICWDRIVSITPVGIKPTYCVTVNPSHLWIVNGLVTGQSISPMGAHTGATMVLSGTVSTKKGYFYTAIQRNLSTEMNAEGTKGYRKLHFEYDWHACAAVRPIYAKYVQREMKSHGQDSDFFRMSYSCEWLLDRGMFVTGARMMELAEPRMERVEGYRQGACLVGIDIAKDVDSTVITVVKPDWDHPNENGYVTHWVLNWLEMQGDFEPQYAQAYQFLMPYWVHAIGVDANGMGTGWPERLGMMFPEAHIEALQSSHQAQHLRFSNLMALTQGHGPQGPLLRWPFGPNTRALTITRRFYSQMINVEKEFTKQGYVLVHAPTNVSTAHDDFPDSLANACVLTKILEQKVSEVEVSDNFMRTRGRRSR